MTGMKAIRPHGIVVNATQHNVMSTHPPAQFMLMLRGRQRESAVRAHSTLEPSVVRRERSQEAG